MERSALHDEIVGLYERHVNPALAKLMAFAGFGLEVRAEGCELIDEHGNRYLDFLGGYGVFSLGHRHPKVVEAVHRQLDELPLSGKVFFSPNQARLAAKLAEISPDGLELTFFSNSGAESVEAALKFAKGATGRSKIVSTHGGYHGKTLGALSATGREKYRKPFEPLMPGPVFVPFGDGEAIRATVDDETACVIIEPIQGEGGIHVPPAGYLREIREACDKVGALMIADEVQTGMGRTGTWFGCNHDGVSPDIMTLAKALGGGVMPIGATMGTPRVFEAVFGENPVAHSSTFGGNPLACAAGLATIEVIEEEGLIDRCAALGTKLLAGLGQVAAAYPGLVKEARGKGLIVGVEFTMDDLGELVIAQMTSMGVVAAYTLNNPRVIRFEPPFIVNEAQIERAIEVFEQAVAQTEALMASIA